MNKNTTQLRAFIISCILLISDNLSAQKTSIPQETLDKLESHMDISYAQYGDRALQLDLYRPDNNQKLPGMVCIHGGGWFKGNRESHANIAKAMAAHGFVAVTISYRLSGEAPFPAAMHDCKAAVRWLRANARKYGVDPEHIGAMGLSAGGHLTALLATSAGVPELEGNGGNPKSDSAIQVAFPMGAQTHLMSERIKEVSATGEKSGIWQSFLRGSQQEQVGLYSLASPITHLDKNDPPMFFFSGENDGPSTHAAVFRDRMKHLGIPNDFRLIPGAPHAFLGKQAWFNDMITHATAFAKEQLNTQDRWDNERKRFSRGGTETRKRKR